VRELPREQAIPLVREIYDKVSPARVGHLERADRNWEFRLFDAQYRRQGQGAFRFAVHPEGYAIYRAKPDWQDRGPRGTLSVYEQFATNPQAYAAIGRYLLDMDMVGEVNLNLAVDDPIPHMLADPRSALRTTFDSLWVRLVDVDRALQVRRYSGPLELTLEVADEFCPWNAGRWRLSVAEDGTARVERTDAAPDLALHAVDLGAAFLGGTRLTALAAAGRVRELTSGALGRATVAFLHDHEPACLEIF
jgi:predicted acetyltransferase